MLCFTFTEDGAPSPLDPPEHLFRIRLVCVVLDTCGQYFDKGSSKKKLDCFLVYFQVTSRLHHIIMKCLNIRTPTTMYFPFVIPPA